MRKSHKILKNAIRKVGAKRISSLLNISRSLVYKWCQESEDAVFHPEQLIGWWAAKASGSPELGARIELEFPGYPNHVWEIVELSTDQRVRLKFVADAQPWQGAELQFEFQPTDDQVFVTLTHITTDQTPAQAFQYFCTKWPLFLVSLKEFLEMGEGKPYPRDIKIQHD